MKQILGFIVYLFLQVIFIPIAIFGILISLYKEMYLSKKLNISFSAGQALQYRWIMHMFDTRNDPNTIEFTKKFPCESHFGLFSVMGPFIISHKLLGFKSTFNKLVKPGYETLDKIAGNRVLIFDEIFTKYIDEVDQIVIPGSGFDLIANKYCKDKNVKVFEMDQFDTLKIKLDTLKKAKIDYRFINYIPVNYKTDSWSELLIRSGFDKNKKTLFLWQSVSLYLDQSLVDQTLLTMKDLSAPGSIIAQDFYSTAFLDGSISKMAISNMNMISKLGEPWKFTLDMRDGSKNAIDNYLSNLNLSILEEYEFGKETSIDPFYSIVVSKI